MPSGWSSADPGGVGQRFLRGLQPSLEAQLVNLADEMAYNAHDIDDGVRSGLVTAEQLMDVPLYRRFHDEALAEFPALQPRGGRRLLFDSIRRMRAAQAADLVGTTQGLLRQHAPPDADAVRRCRRWWPSARRCARPLPSSSASCSGRCTAMRR